MSESRNERRTLEIIVYSGRPLNISANTLHSTGLFDSIEILEDDTTLTSCVDCEGNNVLELANWTSYKWQRGQVLTWDSQMSAIQADKVIKINRTKV